MDAALTQLLDELERFGRENDARNAERPRRMLNITRDTGEFLAVLVRATGARRVLEIGTSNGYSTLWLAHAVRAGGGTVTTVERSDYKVALARANFERSGLGAAIRLLHGPAGEALAHTADASVDLLFLDSDRAEYPGWWPQLGRALAPRGMLVVDNALSHAGELAQFFALVRADRAWASCLVPVGNGEFLAVRDGAGG
ncbi:MAG: methyltransferase domain-containing protein [Betaproteobacteria bacterium]|nr:MAG: methyltransferase domain-containing protein [Betaproteobacteria bacterium]